MSVRCHLSISRASACCPLRYEDYEYLKLLEVATSREHTLSFVREFMPHPANFSDNVASFEALRLRVGRAIEAATHA